MAGMGDLTPEIAEKLMPPILEAVENGELGSKELHALLVA